MRHQERYFDMWAGKTIRYFGHAFQKWQLPKQKSKNQIKPAKNRVLWFSWPAYGKNVTQADITQEIPLIKAAGIDTLIIDDGWELQWGDWRPDIKKFSRFKILVQDIRRTKLKAGLWLTPFCVAAKSPIAKNHPDWLARDTAGKPIRWQKFLRLPPDPVCLDIHQKRVRKYLITTLLRFGKMGFSVFKLDYLVYAFLPNDAGKKQTNTEMYRTFFTELRQAFKQAKLPLELMGCGGPIRESQGLFEFMRFTLDTSFPYFNPFINRVLSSLNTLLYGDGFAVAQKRLPQLGKWYGLVFDGLHIFDDKILIDQKLKKTVSEKMLKIFKKINQLNLNITVGDSLVRSEITQKNHWKKYLQKLKKIKLG